MDITVINELSKDPQVRKYLNEIKIEGASLRSKRPHISSQQFHGKARTPSNTSSFRFRPTNAQYSTNEQECGVTTTA